MMAIVSAAAASVGKAPAMTAAIAPDTGNTRQLIYVVEDEEAVARQVMRALDEFGYPVEWFRDGTSVLRRLQTERPDLCIVDLGLPDIDGIELIGIREVGEALDVVLA